MRHAHSFLVLLVLLFGCGMSTGCSTILSGSSEAVSFTSKTPGTQIKIIDREGKVISDQKAPSIVTLDRGNGYFTPGQYKIVASALGYPDREVPLKAHFNGMYLGNIVFGGLIGMLVVDPLSGAMWDLPNTVEIDFSKPANPPVKVATAR